MSRCNKAFADKGASNKDTARKGTARKASTRKAFANKAMAAALLGAAACQAAVAAPPPATCAKPVYMTFDTGHMGVAPLVAQVLQKHHVRASFFLANERTLTNGSSLDDQWAPWWKARVADGDVFGSHTYDHVYWLKDLPDGKFLVRPSAGPNTGKKEVFTAAQYCDALNASARRFHEMTGAKMAPLFRAPGGHTSPALLKAALACGYHHVGWAPNGFLGDELPSDKYPNQRLLERALQSIRPGDILLAHLGIWSRQDPWAPAVLEPLITGLQARGFCFETLAQHPEYAKWVVPQAAPKQGKPQPK